MGEKFVVAILSSWMLAGPLLAQLVEPPQPPLVNWTAPPYWRVPSPTEQDGTHDETGARAFGLEGIWQAGRVAADNLARQT